MTIKSGSRATSAVPAQLAPASSHDMDERNKESKGSKSSSRPGTGKQSILSNSLLSNGSIARSWVVSSNQSEPNESREGSAGKRQVNVPRPSSPYQECHEKPQSTVNNVARSPLNSAKKSKSVHFGQGPDHSSKDSIISRIPEEEEEGDLVKVVEQSLHDDDLKLFSRLIPVNEVLVDSVVNTKMAETASNELQHMLMTLKTNVAGTIFSTQDLENPAAKSRPVSSPPKRLSSPLELVRAKSFSHSIVADNDTKKRPFDRPSSPLTKSYSVATPSVRGSAKLSRTDINLPSSDYNAQALTELEEISSDMYYASRKGYIDHRQAVKTTELEEIRKKLLVSRLKVHRQEDKVTEAKKKLFGDNYRTTGLPERKLLMTADASIAVNRALVHIPGDEMLRKALNGVIQSKKNSKDIGFEIADSSRTDSRRPKDWKLQNSLFRGISHDDLLEADARELPALPCISESDVSAPTKSHTDALSERRTILAMPKTVHFPKYLPDQIYSNSLVIRNISSTCRRVRCVPNTNSSFFHIVSPKSLDIAPGMSTTFKIVFKPATLGAYNWSVTVETDLGDSLFVPIVAKRNPPLLQITRVNTERSGLSNNELAFDLGHVRAGSGEVVTEWIITNKGGDGRFVLLDDALEKRAIEEETRFNEEHRRHHKSNGVTDSVIEALCRKVEQQGGVAELNSLPLNVGPFTVSPRVWELGAESSCRVTVTYLPKPLDSDDSRDSDCFSRKDQVILRAACDNCTILQIPLSAVSEKPTLVVSALKDSEGKDVLGPALQRHEHSRLSEVSGTCIDMGLRNPRSNNSFDVTLDNLANVGCEFEWKIYNNTGDQNSHHVTEESPERINLNDSLTIVPSSGKFAPKSSRTFKILFSPQSVRFYDILAHLFLPNIAQEPSFVQLRCTGRSVPYEAQVLPTAIHVPKCIDIGETYETELHLANTSASPISFDLRVQDVDLNVFDVILKPHSGLIAPDSSVPVTVSLTGKLSGEIGGFIHATFANGMGPDIRIPLSARSNLSEGKLDFKSNLVDFGLIQLGGGVSTFLPLTNSSGVSLEWEINNKTLENSSSEHVLQVNPKRGRLEPGETQNIDLTFIPMWYQRFRSVLECSIVKFGKHDKRSKSPETSVEVRAEVQTPLVIVSPTDIKLEEVFMLVPCVRRIVLKNMTLLRTPFKWKSTVVGKTTVRVTPEEGEIEGHGEVVCQLELISGEVGFVHKIPVRCTIPNMIEGDGEVQLNVSAHVAGLSVAFELLDTQIQNNLVGMQRSGSKAMQSNEMSRLSLSSSAVSSFKLEGKQKSVRLMNKLTHFWENPSKSKDTANVAQIELNFGIDCPVFANRMQTIRIRNKSAISTNFKIFVVKNPSPSIDDISNANEQTESPTPKKQETTKKLLSKSCDPKAGFTSTSGNTYVQGLKDLRTTIGRMERLLSSGNGAAFHAQPSEGTLGPLKSIDIKITAYNNLVGHYDDNLVIQFDDWGQETFPISLGVVGLPLMFTGQTLIRSESDDPDKINFGARVIALRDDHGELSSAIPPLTTSKKVQLENQSPRTVILKWKHFLRSSSHSRETTKPTQEILRMQNFVSNPTKHSVFTITPDIVRIKPYETATFTLTFRSSETGYFDAVLVSDVGYEDERTGGVAYPMCLKLPLSDMDKDYLEDLRQRLSTVAKIHLRAKAIEPVLASDELKVKCLYQAGRWVGEKVFSLRNNTDQALFFRLSSSSSQFHVVANQETKHGWCTCRPATEIFITIFYECEDTEDRYDHGVRMSNADLIVEYHNGSYQRITMYADATKPIRISA